MKQQWLLEKHFLNSDYISVVLGRNVFAVRIIFGGTIFFLQYVWFRCLWYASTSRYDRSLHDSSNYRTQQDLASADNSSPTLSTKYGHICLQKVGRNNHNA